jgi:hypothetical protein
MNNERYTNANGDFKDVCDEQGNPRQGKRVIAQGTGDVATQDAGVSKTPLHRQCGISPSACDKVLV